MKLNRVDVGFGGGSLLQIANRSESQMMSYMIETPDGKTVMIDGGCGCPEDALHLYDVLSSRGGTVDLWFITHAHYDHFGALAWLLNNKEDFDLRIEKMIFNFPPIEWFKVIENGSSYCFVTDFLAGLEKHGINTATPAAGEMIECGGMTFEILNDVSLYEKYGMINDTSILIRAHFPARDVLFLADLGWHSGDDVLAALPPEKLRCDIVQMAHHGQNGVRQSFYSAVAPKICLYTAPDWLWENDSGGGPNSGPWKTLIVRGWMDDLGVEQSCPIAYGDYLLV